MRALNWAIYMSRKNVLTPCWYMVSLGFKMVDPPIAKFTPWRNLLWLNPGIHDSSAIGAMTITLNKISYGWAKKIIAFPTGVCCRKGPNTWAIKIKPHLVGTNANRLMKRSTNVKWVNSSSAAMAIITSKKNKELGKPIVNVFFCNRFVNWWWF